MTFSVPWLSFSHPWWLPAGAVACLAVVALWRRYDVRQEVALVKFVSVHLKIRLTRSISAARRRMQRGLYLGALAFLFLALSGPLVGYRWERITRRGYDIVFAIDTSRSMSTPDLRPDRLTRAKLAIDDFIDLLDGDAVGIVAFAGQAFLVCPITLDYGAFHESLNAIDTNLIPRGGTNISSAIRQAQSTLTRRRGSDRILILVTDGEDLEGDSLAAARAARAGGLKIYTVGVGTATGELIPIPPSQGGGFVKDDDGTLVKSRLDEAGLQAIAAATGGIYAPLGAQGEGLETIFKAVFGSVAKHDIAVRKRKIYIDRYQWPLAASVALLFLSLLMGNRRRGSPDAAAAIAAGSWLAGLVLWLAMLPSGPAHAGTNPNTDQAQGTAAYRSGRFSQAAQAFEQSIGRTPSDDARRLALQEDAYYNLGNSLYRTGQLTEKTDSGATIEKWTEAVKAYDTALELRADDGDSKYNRDFVQRKLDALRRPPPPGGSNRQPPPQGQPPPPPPQGQPPPPPPQGQPPPPPPQGQPPPPPPQGQPPPPTSGPARPPPPQGGAMTQEEARELLDSEKGEEKHPLSAPFGRPGSPPQKPYKNW